LIEASQQGRVLHLALNRPEKRNALNSSLCHALLEAFAQAEADLSIAVILLSGNGAAFCAGMDLKEAADPGAADLAGLHERLFTIINRIRKPVVASVHGSAFGGGVGLVANAHVAIAAPDTNFGLSEIRLALWPVMIFRALVLAVGERRATELSMTGRSFSAQDAREYGLVTEIADNPLEFAQARAAEIAEYSPYALDRGIDYSRRIRNMTSEDAGNLGRRVREDLMSHPDFERSVKAFLAK
jgi:enoyl-CoA hydratase/carnithine racemase